MQERNQATIPTLALQQQLEALRVENSQLRIKVEGLEQQMQGVRSSVSWRVTAPLRGMMAFVRSLKNSRGSGAARTGCASTPATLDQFDRGVLFASPSDLPEQARPIYSHLSRIVQRQKDGR